ncbi:MAG: FAD-dependent oxidoreductase [Limnochordia bacterium]
MADIDVLHRSLNLGPVRLPNRLVMTPMGTRLAAPGGLVTRELIEYYSARAAGGVGMIITEHTCVDVAGRANPMQLGTYDDSLIPGLNLLAESLTAYGTVPICQLNHAGRQTSSQVIGCQPVSASETVCPNGEKARALSSSEIEHLIELFIKAAARAIRAGFAGVEIHATHGYLLNQFLSPHTNRRHDRYGQDRALLLSQIAAAVRDELGSEAIVGVRLSGSDFPPGSFTLDDACKVAERLEKEGNISYIHVSAGIAESGQWSIQPTYFPRGPLLPLVRRIREKTTLPLIAAGSLGNPQLAAQVIREGAADLVAMGRALLADPDLPAKVQRGKAVRPCIRCNEGCTGRSQLGLPVRCAVNWKTGREGYWDPKPLRQNRSCLIVGGGPAGMQGALVARERGYQVYLCEASSELGGLLKAACVPSFKEDLRDYLAYMRKEVASSGCRILLDTPVSSELIEEFRPDVVLIATGSKPILPSPLTEGDLPCISAAQALLSLPQGRRFAVVGGGAVGCETALHLREKGKDVCLVEMRSRLAADAPSQNQAALSADLAKAGVEVHLESTAEKAAEGHLFLRTNHGIEKLEVDGIIAAVGFEPCRELALGLREDLPFELIGDCLKPGNVFHAISSAAFTAARI